MSIAEESIPNIHKSHTQKRKRKNNRELLIEKYYEI